MTQLQQQHCDHECVCYLYLRTLKQKSDFAKPCKFGYPAKCEYDTRSRPAHPAQAQSPICDRCIADQEPFCLGCYRLKAHGAAIRNATCEPIKSFYERFKHLDKILSEREHDCPMSTCYAEMWVAIKDCSTPTQEQK
jgi:hypothetical protein